MAGGEAFLLHRIFQQHHIPPDEVYAKDVRHRRFMYASEIIVMEEEEKDRKRSEREKERAKRK